jgi:hypothetical protein
MDSNGVLQLDAIIYVQAELHNFTLTAVPRRGCVGVALLLYFKYITGLPNVDLTTFAGNAVYCSPRSCSQEEGR